MDRSRGMALQQMLYDIEADCYNQQCASIEMSLVFSGVVYSLVVLEIEFWSQELWKIAWQTHFIQKSIKVICDFVSLALKVVGFEVKQMIRLDSLSGQKIFCWCPWIWAVKLGHRIESWDRGVGCISSEFDWGTSPYFLSNSSIVSLINRLSVVIRVELRLFLFSRCIVFVLRSESNPLWCQPSLRLNNFSFSIVKMLPGRSSHLVSIGTSHQ